jgi:hypothetical protein
VSIFDRLLIRVCEWRLARFRYPGDTADRLGVTSSRLAKSSELSWNAGTNSVNSGLARRGQSRRLALRAGRFPPRSVAESSGAMGTLTRPHRQATPQRREKTAGRAWDLSPKACAVLPSESSGPRCARRHVRFAGPEDPSGPGCWTTFLTCPTSVDAPDASAAQLMG